MKIHPLYFLEIPKYRGCIFKNTPLYFWISRKYRGVFWNSQKYRGVFSKIQGCILKIHPCIFENYSFCWWNQYVRNIFDDTYPITRDNFPDVQVHLLISPWHFFKHKYNIKNITGSIAILETDFSKFGCHSKNVFESVCTWDITKHIAILKSILWAVWGGENLPENF